VREEIRTRGLKVLKEGEDFGGRGMEDAGGCRYQLAGCQKEHTQTKLVQEVERRILSLLANLSR